MMRSVAVLAAALACAGVSTPVLAASDAVVQVVAVDVKPGKLDDYTSKVAKLTAIMNRLGSQGTVRVWRATVAGPNTGTVIVGLEFPSLAAYADATTKMNADKEFNDLIAGLDGIRTLVSTSLYRDITP